MFVAEISYNKHRALTEPAVGGFERGLQTFFLRWRPHVTMFVENVHLNGLGSVGVECYTTNIGLLRACKLCLQAFSTNIFPLTEQGSRGALQTFLNRFERFTLDHLAPTKGTLENRIDFIFSGRR